jgi:hypothetical protein
VRLQADSGGDSDSDFVCVPKKAPVAEPGASPLPPGAVTNPGTEGNDTGMPLSLASAQVLQHLQTKLKPLSLLRP